MAATVDQPLLDIASDSGETFAVDNPATDETIANVPRMGAAETRRAIARAQDALPAWRSLLAKDRARILRRWADLMLENEDGLARLLTTEQGKPLAESRTEIAYAASFYEWFGEEGKRVYGDGSVKESGIGREGSKYGIEEWLEIKYLATGGV